MKSVCLDFDGVLNTYDGWKGEEELFLPRHGARDFLAELHQRGYLVYIHTTRPEKRIQAWLKQFGLDSYVHAVSSSKPPAIAYVDDRAIRFDGDYSHVLLMLDGFLAYWERPKLLVQPSAGLFGQGLVGAADSLARARAPMPRNVAEALPDAQKLYVPVPKKVWRGWRVVLTYVGLLVGAVLFAVLTVYCFLRGITG